MSQFFVKASFLHRHFFFLLALGISAYFGYHLINGERSTSRLSGLQTDIAELQQEYEVLKSRRESLEQKVVMMRPATLDQDLLEERIRLVLGYARRDEKMVVLTQ